MYGVMAIGNALVDHEYQLSEEQLSATQLTKGNMTLVAQPEQDALLDSMAKQSINPSKLAGGGSAANSMFAFACLGGKAFYGCRVGNDQAGEFYLADLNKVGVATSPCSISQEGVTGSCVVCVTPDGERTMQTYLGTSSDICEHNIDFNVLSQSDWLYFEGYIAMSEHMGSAITKLRQQAGIHGVKIAVSFADPAVVKFAKSGLENLLGNGVEVIFCNLEEAQLFTRKKQAKAAAKALTEYCRIAVVTNGASGALVCQKCDEEKQILEIPTPSVSQVIDTNGAGDNYAGAFLYALSQQYELAQCGKLAGEVASQIIQQFGPRLQASLYQDIAQRVLSS